MSTPPTSPTFTTSFRRNRSYPTQFPHALRCATLTATPEPPQSDYYWQSFGGGSFCMPAISAEIALSKEYPTDNLQIATYSLQNKPACRWLALVNHTNFIKAMYFSLVVSGGGRDFIVIFAIQGSVLSLHMIFRGNLSPSDGDHALTLKTQKEICTHPVYRLSATLNERTREAKRNVSE